MIINPENELRNMNTIVNSKQMCLGFQGLEHANEFTALNVQKQKQLHLPNISLCTIKLA